MSAHFKKPLPPCLFFIYMQFIQSQHLIFHIYAIHPIKKMNEPEDSKTKVELTRSFRQWRTSCFQNLRHFAFDQFAKVDYVLDCCFLFQKVCVDYHKLSWEIVVAIQWCHKYKEKNLVIFNSENGQSKV